MASEPPPGRPPSGPKLGPKLGFDESEQKEFTRALKQGLLVQTPLQVLLETLFSRLQMQAGLFSDLSRRVERMEARDLDSREMLQRLQLCEGKVSALTASKLSPFAQQEVLARLDKLEKQAEGQKASDGQGVGEEGEGQVAADSLASLEARLVTVEGKLSGVYNLAGKLIAVDHMAAQMGIDVPDLEYNPGMMLEDFYPQRKSVPGAAAALPCPSPTASVPPLHTSMSSQPNPALLMPRAPSSTANPSTSAPSSPGRKGAARALQLVQEQSSVTAQDSRVGSPLVGHAERNAELRQQIAEVSAANEQLRATVASLGSELLEVREQLSQRQERLASRVLDLEAGTQGLNKQLAEQHTAKPQAARREAAEVSFADFSLLQSQVEAAVRDVQGARDAVSGLREQDIKQLGDAIAELRETSKRIDAPRDMDTLFHQRLSTLEGRYADLRTEVQQAAAEALQGVAHLSDIEALAREVEVKASQHDIRQLAMQQQTLAQSVNGMAEWLAVRPETSDGVKGTGASATKFKCLTCDREMRTQHGPNGNPTLKGSFLPKLEGMHGTASAAPAGPGLNTARNTGRISPGATRSSWGTGQPLAGQDAPAAVSEEAGLDALPPMVPSAPGADPVKLPPGPASRTPVFL